MKNTIYIFLVFVLVFFLNLLLYIYVDSYREFIKIIKYGDNFVDSEVIIDDSYNINSIELQGQKIKEETQVLLDLGIDQNTQKNVESDNILEKISPTIITSTGGTQETVIENGDTFVSAQDDVGRVAKMTIVSTKILQKFDEKSYEISEKTEKDDLLDIAGEYPDEYLQYGNEKFDLYILSTRKYSEVLDIFSVLEYEMPFSLNKLNSFGTQSFFINLDRPDNKVRFIFELGEEVFGIKVKKTEYETIKNIINTL